ncbi:HNH endonuclease [Arthrobacter rhombi]|uniref:HNH endonuclease n=1 Tax=Arthrobacter rhombi TaxID=71253 RepID=UPI003FCF78FE
MAANRTSTAKWKRIVREVRARDAHLTHCPLCRTGLDWLYGKRPNSAEVDHIVPWAQGGEDSAANARIICRLCNQRRGGKEGRAKQLKPKLIELTTKAKW